MPLLYADLDVSLEPTSTCVVNAEDRLVGHGHVRSQGCGRSQARFQGFDLLSLLIEHLGFDLADFSS